MEVTDAMVQAAAEVLLRDYELQYQADHLTWRDFADVARAALDAAMKASKDETANKLANRALLVFRQDTIAHQGTGEGNYAGTERAVRAYADAAGISYNEAMAATLEAYGRSPSLVVP